MDCGSASKASSTPLKNLSKIVAAPLSLSPSGRPLVYSVSAAQATGVRPGMPISIPTATALAKPLQSSEK
jgi:hypothetical protein